MPRSSRTLSAERIRELARSGAVDLLRQLRAEIVAIERTFPELASGRRAIAQSARGARRRGRTMSAAAKRAVSRRMKRYWAERRKAQAKVK